MWAETYWKSFIVLGWIGRTGSGRTGAFISDDNASVETRCFCLTSRQTGGRSLTVKYKKTLSVINHNIFPSYKSLGSFKMNRKQMNYFVLWRVLMGLFLSCPTLPTTDIRLYLTFKVTYICNIEFLSPALSPKVVFQKIFQLRFNIINIYYLFEYMRIIYLHSQKFFIGVLVFSYQFEWNFYVFLS